MTMDASATSPSAREVWRRGLATAGALALALLFGALIYLVGESNRDRDAAAQRERQSFDIIMLARNIEGSVARAEAALGRFVVNGDIGQATTYRNEWRSAGRQIGQLRRLVRDNAEQVDQVDGLDGFYDDYGSEISIAAGYASNGRNLEALSLYNSAAESENGIAILRALDDIADTERIRLEARSAARAEASERANLLASLMTVAGIILAFAALVLAYATVRAFRDRHRADQRAESLEDAVAARTAELEAVNARLRAEAGERAAAEERLRQVQKLEAVGQLTGGIAHDFNNMLAVVIGGLDLARRKIDEDPDAAGRHIDNALEGANRAAALTRRLLAFARAEPFLPEAVQPGERIENMSDLLRRSISEGIDISIVADTSGWPVWVDPQQLENAILNLAVNARDAMDRRGELQIAIANKTLVAGEVGELAPGDYVEIAVTDNGCGMDEELIEHVFEPFFTTKPVGEGTGLGLSQIFGFARQSGGQVTIDSEIGRGTTVSLYLPRFEGEVSQRPIGATDAVATGGDTRRTLTILVVEDDERVRRSTAAALEEIGHTVIACASGPTALEIAGSRPDIDLLLTDVVMPAMTGPELAARISAFRPELPILFVTGYAGEASDSAQFSGHVILRKPFTVAQLSAAIDQSFDDIESRAAE